MTDPLMERAKTIITTEIQQAGCTVRHLMLFGSRSRGDARLTSDWDFYVVVDQDLPFSRREDLVSRICWRLAEEDIFADVFIQSSKTAAQRRNDPGYLTYYAFREGIEL